MQLLQTFPFQNWNIKYSLIQPESQQSVELETVVFVHGTPWSSVTFMPLAKALFATGAYRILLYDLPGYGQSQVYQTQDDEHTSDGIFEGDTSVKFQAVALDKFLQHLCIDGRGDREAPAVIAHDIAGTIALRTHLLHGCNFRSLLLMDTNTVLPWGDGFYKLVRAEPDVFFKLPSAIYEAMIRAVVRSACAEPKKLNSGHGWEELLVNPWLGSTVEGQSAAQRNFVRQITQASDADVAEMLEKELYREVRCPVKVLWGEQDQWIPKAKMDQLVEMLQHCLREFVVIPNAGHLIMVDQPEGVAVEILSWLQKR